MTASWVLRTLRGVGAVFVALFLLSFFFIVSSAEWKAGAHGVGFLLILLAVALRRRVDGKSFAALLSLALILAGQFLSLAGWLSGLETLPAAAILLLLEILIFLAYPDGFQRLLSTAGGAVLLAVLLNESGLPAPLDVAVLLSVALLAFLWTSRARERVSAEVREPAVYGLLLAVLGFLVPSALELKLPGPGPTATAGLCAFFAGFAFHLLRRYGARRGVFAWTLGTLVAVALATCSAPGVLASLALACVTFYRGEKWLLPVAAFFLAAFLAGFYHHLDLEPLRWSATITASGVVLLASRLYLENRLSPEVPR